MATVFVDYLTGNAFTAPAPLHPRRVRFTITPVMRFKEAKKLAQAKAQPKKYAGVQGRQALEQLEVAAERETKANDDDFNRFTGTRVLFGQQVQLLHQESKSTIEITKERAETAHDDNSYTDMQLLDQQRISATEANGKGNVFRIMPGYATRHEGNPVSYGDVIILTSPAMNVSLHARRMGTTPTVQIEESMYTADREAIVGSSLLVTRFRAVPISKFSYNKAVYPELVNLQLFGGSFVHLFHKVHRFQILYLDIW